ncbi:hypothetical protein JRO89_XS03G0284500 [Xanthoceras sorbifolium]|uniref:Prolamin-like domain-containing protein n=1 Tax=Xanthoceras sorbifolium TaxID=99658 RepID=A0ABQ8ICG4_9ROSI|nr:hypothetical protein JRO89_XS03G0284500 [Xanthoceras sorbifolium]
MSQARVQFSIALILACVFMVIAPSLAAEPAPGFPPLFEQDPDAMKCLSTLQSVQGCVQEVITSFLSHQVQLIGPACCKSLNEVDDKCWPRVFPFDPFFHHCSRTIVQLSLQVHHQHQPHQSKSLETETTRP